jgi:serine protease Do
MEPRRITHKIASSTVGSVVKIAVWRDGKPLTLPVAIAELPGKSATSSSKAFAPDAAPAVVSRDLGLTFVPITRETRARFGMTDQDTGVMVDDVKVDSVASDRGIAAGSVIVKMGGSLVTSPIEAHQRLQDAADSDRTFILVLMRDEQGLRWVVLPLKPV